MTEVQRRSGTRLATNQEVNSLVIRIMAENRRLRAALTEIAEGERTPQEDWLVVVEIRAIAKAALEQSAAKEK